jgi:hypothetical protein
MTFVCGTVSAWSNLDNRIVLENIAIAHGEHLRTLKEADEESAFSVVVVPATVAPPLEKEEEEGALSRIIPKSFLNAAFDASSSSSSSYEYSSSSSSSFSSLIDPDEEDDDEKSLAHFSKYQKFGSNRSKSLYALALVGSVFGGGRLLHSLLKLLAFFVSTKPPSFPDDDDAFWCNTCAYRWYIFGVVFALLFWLFGGGCISSSSSSSSQRTNEQRTMRKRRKTHAFPGDRSMTTRESFLLSLFLFFFFFFESAGFGWCEKENRFNALLLVCVVGDVPFSLNGWLVGWLVGWRKVTLSLERESSDTHTRADAECSDSPRRPREFLRFLRC